MPKIITTETLINVEPSSPLGTIAKVTIEVTSPFRPTITEVEYILVDRLRTEISDHIQQMGGIWHWVETKDGAA